MQRFDCLSLECPLFGPHLLEASAGTGKTFSIEHIYVRLIFESIEVEQILVVTFTRAATRELKARIRSNLEKALGFLQENQTGWEYLKPYFGSSNAKRLLADALSLFDRCQIFTIHGFCFRMLREYAFEAKVGFSLSDPDQGITIPDRIQKAAVDFIEWGFDEELICPEQLALFIKKYRSIQDISDRLLRLEKTQGASFSELFEGCKAALHKWTGQEIEEIKLLEDFDLLKKGYKVLKGNHEKQVVAIAACFRGNRAGFAQLLKERGSLFKFLDASNRKVNVRPPSSLHYPGFFDWAAEALRSLIEEGSGKILQVMQAFWYPIAERLLSEEEYFGPDEILSEMRRAIDDKMFALRVQQKYVAVIIDEFQDTDALQWDIFHRLFLQARALYLVGDPKQSIYRFRKADIYTYLKARDLLGDQHLYQLDTNFRSSKKLVDSLNALFSREWLHLPQVKRTLPYHPVKAGLKIDPIFADEKGAVHFFIAKGDPNELFDSTFLPFAVQEIERLQLEGQGDFALLVKDRFQAEKALQLLRQRGIKAIAKSHVPIGQTLAFQIICELFDAIANPRDSSLAKIVLAGPFELADKEFLFSDYKIFLEERGLVAFCRFFLNSLMKERLVRLDLYRDVMQLFEVLFAWERKEGFSFEGLKRHLKYIEELDSQEGGRRRMEVGEKAVQIMTLHISKGLEFDVVFALALATRTPDSEREVEELEAEKLRQLYVAMTRARKRMYVPIALSEKEAEIGTHSPMELFSRHLSFEELDLVSKKESVTLEQLPSLITLSPPSPAQKNYVSTKEFKIPSFTPSFLSSFTSLARKNEKENKWREPLAEGFTLHTLPRGTEIGIVVHQIFEALFTANEPIWCDLRAIEALVAEQLRFSPFLPWKAAIQEMVYKVVNMPLQAEGEFFSLSELNVGELRAEIEFHFAAPPHFIKGFIDLVFFHRGKYYFLDWKTNWLGGKEEDYLPQSLEKAMDEHDYGLQAALYREALGRHIHSFDPKILGGCFYIFLRGCAYVHFHPDLTLIQECYARPDFD